MVFFMGVSVSGEVARQLIEDGMDPETPAAIVFGGGGDESFVVSAPLSEIGTKADQTETSLPGLMIVGDVTRYRFRTDLGALQGSRVLLTMSEALQTKAARHVIDFGGVPVGRPLIRLELSEEGLESVQRIREYDWVVVTSPSSVRCFGELLRRERVDVRSVPKLVSCGGGTSEALVEIGFHADVEPEADFGAEGLLKAIGPFLSPGARVLRLRSDKAGPYLADSLRRDGAVVDDCVLYRNVAVPYGDAPQFDSVVFASASAVESFDALWGMDLLRGKTVAVIGKPTLAALTKRGFEADIVGPEATVESCLGSLAEYYVCKALAALDAGARGEGKQE
jgi:uroporphyrinogen III methyltransferase/synthase